MRKFLLSQPRCHPHGQKHPCERQCGRSRHAVQADHTAYLGGAFIAPDHRLAAGALHGAPSAPLKHGPDGLMANAEPRRNCLECPSPLPQSEDLVAPMEIGSPPLDHTTASSIRSRFAWDDAATEIVPPLAFSVCRVD